MTRYELLAVLYSLRTIPTLLEDNPQKCVDEMTKLLDKVIKQTEGDK
ncbi:hypothetical protein AGMMS49975_02450 [Clostridia bacterium]|nr:hypothetical protein AGMMS49975_02450 [Clostridia bacterium]